jgi:inner membrane protein
MRAQQIEQAAVASRFGVQLITPVDIYHRAERSTKYGALFILLTFCTFFVVELLQRRRLHPVQYLLVGAALCLFYLLLISLSEHIGFGFAYLSAAVATIGVIGMYAAHVLGGLGQGVRMVAGLSLLYGFLYVLLQLEDYALLVGSISLFLILAAVMYATRRVNWYAIGRSPASPESPNPV